MGEGRGGVLVWKLRLVRHEGQMIWGQRSQVVAAALVGNEEGTVWPKWKMPTGLEHSDLCGFQHLLLPPLPPFTSYVTLGRALSLSLFD